MKDQRGLNKEHHQDHQANKLGKVHKDNSSAFIILSYLQLTFTLKELRQKTKNQCTITDKNLH